MVSRPALFLLSVLPTGPLAAQAYSAPAVRYYRSVNPFHMYWVRGKDTLGAPTRLVSVERQEWSRRGDELRVVVAQHTLDVTGRRTVDTLDLAATGHVKAINGAADRLRGRYDFVPRLPSSRTLAPGVAWSDSVGSTTRGPAGDYAFIATRRYTVARLFDTLGRRVAEIKAEGRLRYQDAYFTDSLAGLSIWLDVSGPMRERALFDQAKGELVLHSWDMHLRGRGGMSGVADTLPAGLISANHYQLIPEASGTLVARPLPPGDTSITVQTGDREGVIFLHTVQRTPDGLASGFIRNDGMVGTTVATFRDGRPTRYEALWTDSSLTARRIMIERRSDSLVVRDSVTTRAAIPRANWAIADYGMSEHLVPLFRTLRPDTTHALAIYRPYPGHWDTLTAVATRLDDGFLVVTKEGANDSSLAVYIIVDDGDLLFAENAGPRGAQFLPRPGSLRRARLDRILEELQSR